MTIGASNLSCIDSKVGQQLGNIWSSKPALGCVGGTTPGICGLPKYIHIIIILHIVAIFSLIGISAVIQVYIARMEVLFCATENVPHFVNIWTLWSAYSFNGPENKPRCTTNIHKTVAAFWEGLLYGFQ